MHIESVKILLRKLSSTVILLSWKNSLSLTSTPANSSPKTTVHLPDELTPWSHVLSLHQYPTATQLTLLGAILTLPTSSTAGHHTLVFHWPQPYEVQQTI